MIGDNFGVCFIKIGLVFPQLCTQKFWVTENAIQNIWGSIFPNNLLHLWYRAYQCTNLICMVQNFAASVDRSAAMKIRTMKILM